MAMVFADEDFSYTVVDQLRKLGYDVLTAQQANQANRGATDEEILAFAVAANRVLVTFNRRHFIQLHRRSSSHCGMIVCTRDPDSDALAARIDEAISVRSDLANQLIRIVRPNKP